MAMRLIPSYGTAFRAPTFVDLYYPGGQGNPDLKAEKSAQCWSWTLKGSYNAIGQLVEVSAVPKRYGRYDCLWTFSQRVSTCRLTYRKSQNNEDFEACRQ